MSSDKRKLPTRLLTREERAEKRAKITERVATESALKHAAANAAAAAANTTAGPRAGAGPIGTGAQNCSRHPLYGHGRGCKRQRRHEVAQVCR